MSLKIARVESFNYPEVPRYFFPTIVVEDKPEYLSLYHPLHAPLWSGKDGQYHRNNSHSLSFLYPDRDYNVVLFWNPDWTFSSYYVNIALPMRWDGDMCYYVDLDLDVLYIVEQSVRVLEGRSEPGVIELDRDEFEERKLTHNYPAEIVARAESGLREVLAQIEAQAFPFDGSLLNWRPPFDAGPLSRMPDDMACWHL